MFRVLLDEMNLASQSVLEGLNSCLDHRGEIYIPELDRTFRKHDNFRVFAAQNPQAQGGGRKGLPQSFLNRFTKVYVEELQQEDFLVILRSLEPDAPQGLLENMVAFTGSVADEVRRGALGQLGSPWEFNLRDILRWLRFMRNQKALSVADTARILFCMRFRNTKDQNAVARLFNKVFSDLPALRVEALPALWPSPHALSIEGCSFARRTGTYSPDTAALVQATTNQLEGIAQCVSAGALCILTGTSAAGKTALIQSAAAWLHQSTAVITLNPMSDAGDLLGGFEQRDAQVELSRTFAAAKVELGDFLCQSAAQAELRFDELRMVLRILRILQDPSSSAALVHLSSDPLFAFLAERCPGLLLALNQTRQSQGTPASTQFVWVDGPLVRSLRDGSWLVLEDANLCPPAVLDRLNSLFEPGPELLLIEKGSATGRVEAIKPHPNFRLFMTASPAVGELSRAMRNRGIEISLDAPARTQKDEDQSRVRGALRADRPSLRSNGDAALSAALFGSRHLQSDSDLLLPALARPNAQVQVSFDDYGKTWRCFHQGVLALGATESTSMAVFSKLIVDPAVASAFGLIPASSPCTVSRICARRSRGRLLILRLLLQTRNWIQYPLLSRATTEVGRAASATQVRLQDQAVLLRSMLSTTVLPEQSFAGRALQGFVEGTADSEMADFVRSLQLLIAAVDSASTSLSHDNAQLLLEAACFLFGLGLQEHFDKGSWEALRRRLITFAPRSAGQSDIWLKELQSSLNTLSREARGGKGFATGTFWQALWSADLRAYKQSLDDLTERQSSPAFNDDAFGEFG